jgi:hypothetical protein
MSDSPFSDFGNATIEFATSTAGFVEIPGSINQVPITGILSLEVMLSADNKEATIAQIPGSNQIRQKMNGRAIDPFLWPPQVQIGHRGKCKITDHVSGSILQGDFQITSLVQSPFTAVTEALGTKFEGILTTEAAGETIWS